MFADVEELVLGSLPFCDLVLHDESVVLEEVDISDVAIFHAEVDGLIRLQVLDVVYDRNLLRFPPIPKRNAPVHVIRDDVLRVERWFCDAIKQSPDPLRPPNSARLTRQYKFLAIRKKLNIISWRCYKIYINWFSDAYIMLNDSIGHRYDIRRDRMCRHCDGCRFMPLQRYGFILGEIIERDFIMSASEEDIGIELVDIYHIGVLVRMEFVGILVHLFGEVVSVLQDEAVGVTTEESVLEGFDLVKDRRVAVSQALGVGNFCWLWDGDGLLLIH